MFGLLRIILGQLKHFALTFIAEFSDRPLTFFHVRSPDLCVHNRKNLIDGTFKK
jgi:hypothetical protein